MRRTRSLELRWAVRYAVVTAVVLALFGVVVDQLVERALRRDAELVLELELAELLEELDEETLETAQELARMVAPEMASAQPDLRLSFQIFDPQGEIRYGRGVLHEAGVPLLRGTLAEPGRRVLRDVELGGEYDYPFLVMAASAGEDGAVQVGVYSRVFARSARRIRDGFLAAVPVGLLLAAGVGLYLARSSLRPVSQIVAAARRITSERLDEDIPTTGSGDELDQIAEAFNDVLDRIRSAIAALRHFSADAAHQLRSPLTALRTRLEVTLEANDLPADQRALLEGVLRDVTHMSEAVDAMLQLSRSEAGLDPSQRAKVDLEALVRSVAEFFEPLAEQQGLTLSCDTRPARVSGDATWLRQLFVNLVENALAYTADGGRVEIRLERTPREAVVEVRDTGRGIAPGEQDQIFERFHRADTDTRTGLGLGLTLARVIALAHRGSIAVESEPAKGSRFTVRLPALPEDGTPAPAAPGDSAA